MTASEGARPRIRVTLDQQVLSACLAYPGPSRSPELSNLPKNRIGAAVRRLLNAAPVTFNKSPDVSPTAIGRPDGTTRGTQQAFPSASANAVLPQPGGPEVKPLVDIFPVLPGRQSAMSVWSFIPGRRRALPRTARGSGSALHDLPGLVGVAEATGVFRRLTALTDRPFPEGREL
jgi:hypothetical protein